MRPLVRTAIAAALVIAIARFAEQGMTSSYAPNAAPSAPAEPSAEVPCPAGSLPDDGACIPVPTALPGASEEPPRQRDERLHTYEHIPLRPERSAEYGAYRWPVPIVPQGVEPSSEPGSRSVLLAVPRGTAVRAAALEHQKEPAEVVYSGALFGRTLVTRHTLREGGAEREYLTFYGNLERAAAGLEPGAPVARDAIVGFVGGKPSGQLRFEVRRVRDGVRVRDLAAPDLTHDARTIAVDPRNVLERYAPE